MLGTSFFSLFYILLALVGIFLLFYFSGSILTLWMRALPLKKEEYIDVYEELSLLSRRTGIPIPQVFLLKEPSPNAFAIAWGRRRKPSIFVTEGILSLLSRQEMRALFSLCFAQIKFKRFLFSPVLAVLVFPMAKISSFLPILLSFPLNTFVSLTVFTCMRTSRLFLVDAYGKAILQDSDTLAVTMRKMHSVGRKVPLEYQHVAFDHLFLFPIHRGEERSLLLDTHPWIEDRIDKVLRLSPSCIA